MKEKLNELLYKYEEFRNKFVTLAKDNFEFSSDHSSFLNMSKKFLEHTMGCSPEPAIKQIWKTQAISKKFPCVFGERYFVLTIVKDGVIRGVPITNEWYFAAKKDVVIPSTELPHRWEEQDLTCLQLWAEMGLEKDHLCSYEGELKQESFNVLQSCLSYFEGQEVERNFLGFLEIAEDIALEQWEIKDPVDKGMYTYLGGQIICEEDDPRLMFRKHEVEDLEYVNKARIANHIESVEEK